MNLMRLIVFIAIIIMVSFAEDYILTDLGRGVEKINVDLLTPEPVYIQDSPTVKVYVIKFKDRDLPVAAGMSGSPLVSNGKIIGALFAGYSFQKEPLAFVLPIEYMDSIKSNSEVRKGIFNNLPVVLNFPNQKAVNLFSTELKKTFSSNFIFNAIQPSLSYDVSNTGNDVKEGSSISVALVDGDIKITGTGTLTKIDKDGYFVAFGHAFFNVGKISAPVYKSNVITIVNRYDDSFKLAVVTNRKIGSIVFDSNYGILGKLGQDSKMIPLKIGISLSSKELKNYSCYVVDNDKLVYLLSLITFYSAISNYVESDLPYEFRIKLGFVNGRVQDISIPSINTPIEKLLPVVYEYLNFLSSIPSSDNKLNFIDFSLDIKPQDIGIINNISISNKEDNNISFGINYFDPINKKNEKEVVNIVFPTEAANENLYFGVGGEYDLPRIFEDLGISWTKPKDFNQLLTFINFFSRPDPRSLSVVISTKLYGAINYQGKVIPLTSPQLYKYYLQFNMPFIYLSYYPIIIREKTKFIPIGYDVFQIDVNGSISKAEREKKEKTIFSYVINNNENIDFEKSILRRSSTENIEKEIYDIFQEYNKKNEKNSDDKQSENLKTDDNKEKDYKETNTVILSNYDDLIDGIQNNVFVDYQGNIYSSSVSLSETKVKKNFFKILSYNKKMLGFSYDFDNYTSMYVFERDGKIKYTKRFKNIFSDVRFSNNKIIASTFDGTIYIINPNNFEIEKKIDTDYVFKNVDFYKNYIVATNVRYPSSIVFFSLDGQKLREEILPFIDVSNLSIDGDNILVACYGGMVLVLNDREKKYFQTYQENVTAINVVDGNLLIGTYPKPYIYIVPDYKNSGEYSRPILYDGFDSDGYVEDISSNNEKIFLSYKGNKLSVFSIDKSKLFGSINQFYQRTPNLNWEKLISIPNVYWFIPFVSYGDYFGIPYISNTFTVISFVQNKNSDESYYISKVFDSGQQKYLYSIFVRGDGSYKVFVRMGNNPIVDQSWTNWFDARKLQEDKYKYRYFQYKIILYPNTTIYSVLGLFRKLNYKPFFIVDLNKKVYNSKDTLKVNLWDPNGDTLNVCLEYYKGVKTSSSLENWVLLEREQVETKKTDINNPDFNTDLSLSLSSIRDDGKVRLKISVDDSPSNFNSYFVQEQEFEIFIDNTKPTLEKYTYKNGMLEVIAKDQSFVEVFIEINNRLIPMILKKIEGNRYFYYINLPENIKAKDDRNSFINIVLKDEAGNTNKITPIL